MAEIHRGKQRYLAERFPGVPIFQDVTDLTRLHAPTSDGGSIKVPEVHEFW